MHLYVHAIIISEKGGHEFKGECGSLHGRTWRGVRKERNVVIIL